jgi:hypothetical protein
MILYRERDMITHYLVISSVDKAHVIYAKLVEDENCHLLREVCHLLRRTFQLEGFMDQDANPDQLKVSKLKELHELMRINISPL